MENKSYLMIIIGVVVAVMLTATVMIPLVNTVTEVEEYHYTNENQAGDTWHYVKVDRTSLRITYTEGDGYVTFHGGDYYPTPQNIAYSITPERNYFLVSDQVAFFTTGEYPQLGWINKSGNAQNIANFTSVEIIISNPRIDIIVTTGSTVSNYLTAAPKWVSFPHSSGSYVNINSLGSTNMQDVFISDVKDIYGAQYSGGWLASLNNGEIINSNPLGGILDITTVKLDGGGLLLKEVKYGSLRMSTIFVPEVVEKTSNISPAIKSLFYLIPVLLIAGIIGMLVVKNEGGGE
jgi:hypothetical protein